MTDHQTAIAALMAELGAVSDDPEAGLAALAALADPDVLALFADAADDADPADSDETHAGE